MNDGAPSTFSISRVQLPEAKPKLLIAVSYPPGTSFTIQATTKSSCNTATKLCSHMYTEVGSVDAVRASDGDTYHFDGTHLYMLVVQNGNSELGTPMRRTVKCGRWRTTTRGRGLSVTGSTFRRVRRRRGF